MSIAPATPATIPQNPPDLRAALNFALRKGAAATFCAQTGTVQAFDPDAQTADVTLNMTVVVGYEGTNPPVPVTRAYPPLPALPVLFLGGGGAYDSFPVAAGDECLVVFVDRDMDSWWLSGQTGLPPNTPRTHNISDGVCIVGLRSLPRALPSVSTTDVQRHGPGGELITMGGGKIGISNASQSLLSVLDALLTALTSWVNTGGSTPNAGTIAALTTVKTNLDALLK